MLQPLLPIIFEDVIFFVFMETNYRRALIKNYGWRSRFAVTYTLCSLETQFSVCALPGRGVKRRRIDQLLNPLFMDFVRVDQH